MTMGDRMLSEGAGGRAADAAPSGAVFMVVSGEQVEAAKAVARHLPFASYALNPYTDLTVPLADVNAIERPVGFVVTPRAIAAARRAVRRALALAGGRRAVLVAGQDEGTVERAAIATARAAGARLVMMPDGIPTNVKALPPLRRRPAWLVKEPYRPRARCQSCARRPAERPLLQQPRPRAQLGPGLGRRDPAGRAGRGHRRLRLAPVGRPCAIAPPPGVGNILVCSQPLLGRSTTASPREGRRRLVPLAVGARAGRRPARPGAPAPRGAPPRYRLPGELSPLAGEPPRPVLDDIGWADIVIAPFSTVLVEAVGAGRVPMTAGGRSVWGRTAGNAFLEDPRVACIDFRRSPGVEELLATAEAHAAGASELREDYMAHIGSSSERSAEAIGRPRPRLTAFARPVFGAPASRRWARRPSAPPARPASCGS